MFFNMFLLRNMFIVAWLSHKILYSSSNDFLPASAISWITSTMSSDFLLPIITVACFWSVSPISLSSFEFSLWLERALGTFFCSVHSACTVVTLNMGIMLCTLTTIVFVRFSLVTFILRLVRLSYIRWRINISCANYNIAHHAHRIDTFEQAAWLRRYYRGSCSGLWLNYLPDHWPFSREAICCRASL